MTTANPDVSVHVTRNTPQLVICLVDESQSMSTLSSSDTMQRSLGDIVQDSLTELIQTLGEECIQGSEGFKNYFYLSVLGYSGKSEDFAVIEDLFPGSGSPTTEIRSIQDFFEAVDEENPISVTPNGRTPTKAAFEEAQRLIELWDNKVTDIVGSTAAHYPAPIILSITDGRYDSTLRGMPTQQHLSPKSVIDNICSKTYSRFDTPVVMNIHITPCDVKAEDRISFPNHPPEGPDEETQYAREMYYCSSLLTEDMRKAAVENGFVVSASSRAMLYHANPADLIKLLSIGTRANTRVSITGVRETPINNTF